jgi:hypothetical protein
MNAEPSVIELPTVTDGRGGLTFAEANGHVPHAIARVFYVYGVAAGVTRGAHAHRTLHETLVALAGRLTLTVFDGRATRRFVLDSPRRAVHVPPMHWIELTEFAPETVCLVLASAVYEEADYVRDRSAFVVLAETYR